MRQVKLSPLLNSVTIISVVAYIPSVVFRKHIVSTSARCPHSHRYALAKSAREGEPSRTRCGLVCNFSNYDAVIL